VIGATALLLLLAVAPAADGRLPFGTKSEAAAAAAREALQILVRSGGQGPNSRTIGDVAQRAVDADPDFALAHYLLGYGFRADWPDASEVQFERARALAPQAPEGERRFIEAALLWRAQGRDEARDAFEALARDYPNEPIVHLNLGLLYGSRDEAAARKAFEAAARLDPAAAFAHWQAGNLYAQKHEAAVAREQYEAAWEQRQGLSQAPDLLISIALTYLEEGRRPEALARVDEHLRLRSASTMTVSAWNFIGHLRLEAGDAAGGLAAYEKGHEWLKTSGWSPDEQQVWIGRYHHGRSRCLARLGRHEEAWAEAEVVRRMIEAGGEAGKQYLPAYHFLAGYVKLEAGDAKAAVEHLEQAGAQHDPHRTLLLSRAYEKLGEREKAREGYRTVLERRGGGLESSISYPEARARLAVLDAPASPAEAKR